MSRDLTAAMSTGIAASDVTIVLFFEGEFASGTVRLCTYFQDLTWDSKTWIGAGTFVGISDIEENTEVVASGVTVSLSGVEASLVSAAISEARQNMPGKVWIGLLDENEAVIADPFEAFGGFLDVPEISDGQDTCTVSITYENKLVDLLRAREWRYTHESQQVLAPGDRGFEFVTSIQDKELVWGRG